MMILVACEHVGFRRKESMTAFLCVNVRCYVYGVLKWLVMMKVHCHIEYLRIRYVVCTFVIDG